jgi:Sugar kinases, ribokinase family
MKPLVVVVGSFVQDLVFVSDCFPVPGETTLGSFSLGPGGKGSNQAVACARAGVATRFIGAVGADTFGDGARAFHRREGIDSRLIQKKRHATGTAAIMVDREGRNQIIVAIGASAQIAPRDVPAAWLRDARVVIAQHEASLAINAHIFRAARRVGATTILNPAPMRADFDPAMLRHVDVLVPNETEFAALAQLAGQAIEEPDLALLDDPSLQQLCRRLGVPTVIVTLGARGCFVSFADRSVRLRAHRVKVVDSTGAGDAFVGNLAAGFVKFRGDLLRAAHFANAAAALSVTKPGTSRSMPSFRETLKLASRVLSPP